MLVEAVKQDHAGPTIARHEFTIQGAKIVAYESGQGMPVLLLHGSPDTHDMWLPLMGHLNEHVRSMALE